MSLRVGLIGCGRWGRHILRDLIALGARVEVVSRSEASRAVARAGGAAACHAAIAELPPQDGYVVAVPTVSHVAVIEALLPRGRPIFCEKPLSPRPDDIRRLAPAAGRIFVMYKWRYHPGVAAMARLRAEGVAGEPLLLHCLQLGWGHPHPDVDPPTILLPHALSMVLEVLGEVPPLQWARPLLPGEPALGLVAELAAAQGPRVLLECSVVHPQHRRSLTLVGRAASLDLPDSYAESLTLRRGPPAAPGPAEALPIGRRLPLEIELEAFLRHLEGGPPPLSSLADELLIVERLQDIRRAAGLPPP